MKSTIMWGLVALNALLLMALVWRPATAVGQVRRPPDYALIPGTVQGQPTDVIYVIDTTNGVLGGIAYDETKGHSMALPTPISLDQIFDRTTRR